MKILGSVYEDCKSKNRLPGTRYYYALFYDNSHHKCRKSMYQSHCYLVTLFELKGQNDGEILSFMSLMMI